MSCVGPLLLGGKPKLLQHAQVIVCFPLLDYLASFEAMYGDASEFHPSATGRAKLLCASLVRAAYSVAAYHPIALAYHVFDTDVEVGEGSKERGGKLLGLLVAPDILIGFVPDDMGA